MEQDQRLIGVIFILVLFVIVSFIAARKVRTLSDFFVSGRKMGTLPLTGAVTAAFMGGTSTIGTAQMGYEYGISGIFVTLGGGVACLLISLFFLKIYRQKEIETIPQLLAITYGDRPRPWIAGYTAVGMFIQVFIQIVAAIPLFKYILHLGDFQGGLIAFLLISLSVVFGGIWSSNILGILKIILLLITLLYAGIQSFHGLTILKAGGLLPQEPWFNLFPRGVSRELFNGISMIIGFLSTQAFIQPIFSVRDYKSARNGLLLTAVIIPTFGLMAVFIGMITRQLNPGLRSAEALPYYLTHYMNPLFGGLAIGTILFSVITSGAAITLSMSTVITRDLIGNIRHNLHEHSMMLISRFLILFIGLIALAFGLYNAKSLILDWTYFSNVIRGVTVFVPFMIASIFGKRIRPESGFFAVMLAPVFTIILFLIIGYTVPPLPIGLGFSLIILVLLNLKGTD